MAHVCVQSCSLELAPPHAYYPYVRMLAHSVACMQVYALLPKLVPAEIQSSEQLSTYVASMLTLGSEEPMNESHITSAFKACRSAYKEVRKSKAPASGVYILGRVAGEASRSTGAPVVALTTANHRNFGRIVVDVQHEIDPLWG